MSLPITWVDRIFNRLTVRYGVRFLNHWKGVDIDAVRHDWANVLAGFENWPEAFLFAFEHMDDEKPPTAAMFRSMAMKAPKPERLALPEPKADPSRVAAELAKLVPMKAAIAAPVDHKAWAKRLQARHAAGDNLNHNQVRCYRNALGLNIPAV